MGFFDSFMPKRTQASGEPIDERRRRRREEMLAEMEEDRLRAEKERQRSLPRRKMVHFDFGADGFPFIPGDYVYMEGHKDPDAYLRGPVWFADDMALARIHDQAQKVLRSLLLAGVDDMAAHALDFSEIQPVTRPDQDVPRNYAVASLNPPTKIGRAPKYTGSVMFQSDPKEDWDAFTPHDGYTMGKVACRGNFEYLPDATLAKAFLSVSCRDRNYMAHFKLFACELKPSHVTMTTYGDGAQRVIYKL